MGNPPRISPGLSSPPVRKEIMGVKPKDPPPLRPTQRSNMGLTTGKRPVPDRIVNRELIWGYKVGDFSIVGDYCDGPFCFNPTGRIDSKGSRLLKVYCCFDCEDWDRLLND